MSMTVLDGEGFPLHYLTPNCIEKYRSIRVGACDGGAAWESEPGDVEPDQLTLPAMMSHESPLLEIQLSRRQAVVSGLPEHLRCVVPDECGQMDSDQSSTGAPVELLLKYEDCFVGASGKVGWTDVATHSIDTGVSRPVKQPPRRTSFEEKDQIERQLSDLLLDGKIQASESPWASPVLLIKKKDGSWRFCLFLLVSAWINVRS